MTGATVNRCAFPGCARLTTADRCARHTSTEHWALVKRLALPGSGDADGYTLTLRLPRFDPDTEVQASITWQGQPPAADDAGVWKALARQLKALGAELGVRITLADEHPGAGGCDGQDVDPPHRASSLSFASPKPETDAARSEQ